MPVRAATKELGSKDGRDGAKGNENQAHDGDQADAAAVCEVYATVVRNAEMESLLFLSVGAIAGRARGLSADQIHCVFDSFLAADGPKP